MDTSSQSPIQLTPEQLALLGEWSALTGRTKEELLAEALRAFKPAAFDDGETDGESLYDRLNKRNLIGCLKGPPDLSTNPKYMEGFGK